MAKKPYEIQERAKERHEREKRREKTRENRKLAKEYFRQERNARLPSFIITIIAFVILVGAFTGLYTQYDYKIDFNPREFSDIDLSASVDINSSAFKNSALSVFTFLGSTSNSLTNIMNSFVSALNFGGSDVQNEYLSILYNSGYEYIYSRYGWIRANSLKFQMKHYLCSVANPGYYTIFNSKVPEAHYELSHWQDLSDIAGSYGWSAADVHDKFLTLEICHEYNGEKYTFCD